MINHTIDKNDNANNRLLKSRVMLNVKKIINALYKKTNGEA
ncbi:hypothetical protein lbkm_1601 [Lachnospiraceae bacterium KM106-2]|nr:hypothetical protein lbkm_1601 [Lachnospiraceae bacterium KM106-2]